MAHDEVVFNGKNFIENLNLILRTEKEEYNELESYISMFELFRNNLPNHPNPFGVLDSFFKRYSTDKVPLTNWDDFVKSFNDYLTESGINNISENDLLENFVIDFKKMVGFEDSSGGDWGSLHAAAQGFGVDSDGFHLGVHDSDIERYFKSSFSHFLATYPYVNSEGEPVKTGEIGKVEGAVTFFENWTKFMTRTAEFFDDQSTTENNVSFAAYQLVFDTFFPEAAEGEYGNRLREFWKEKTLENGSGVAQRGWFIPSHHFDEWFEELREEFLRGTSRKSTELFTVSTPASQRVMVIDRILRLLIDMIDIMQRISASQAKRLEFLTAWQRAYTNLIAEVPVFTQGDGSQLDDTSISGSSDEATARKEEIRRLRTEEANPLMQSVQQDLRGKRDQVQTEAKQMQTTINQSQDAVNQQTQMATALLQQLSTIISQIFR